MADITLALATDTLTCFKQLVVDLNDEMKAKKIVFLRYAVDVVFDPTDDDFRKYKTAAEYLEVMQPPTQKVTLDELAFVIDKSPREFAKLFCTKAEYNEFKKNGYNHLRAKWLAEQKKKNAAKKNDASAIKRKIAKLQAQLAELEA